MSGNTFGEVFTVTTFGESHGAALGCVVDGCPVGIPLSAADIARELSRRRPGGSPASTTRNEADEPEILSGVFEGRTLGTPIAVIIRNTDHHSHDYNDLREVYRPGHADWTWQAKFGVRDHRGGGRSSGRETAGRVAAGAIAKAVLAEHGVSIRAWVSSIDGIAAPAPDALNFSLDAAEANPLRLPCAESSQTYQKILARIEALKQEGDSAGGIVACAARGVPAGLGEPVFGKLDARLAQAVLSIGAAKAVEFGAPYAAEARGSEFNDAPLAPPPYWAGAEPDANGMLSPNPSIHLKNNAGGVLGGISNGLEIRFNTTFKPVPSIARAQLTVDSAGHSREIHIKGRHDVCIAPRAVPVVEAMTALVIADLFLLQWGRKE